MTLQRVLVSLFVLIGISFAQDVDLGVGPQYLVTNANPMLLRPIATPSLSLSGETLAGTTEIPLPVELPAFAPVETVAYLGNVYWGEHKQEEVFARRVQTPSMTPDQTQWYMNEVANQSAPPPAASSPETTEAAPAPSVIELTGGPIPANLPSSLMDVGVTGSTNLQALRLYGYGLSLGEVAAFWKTHKRQAPRVLTNQDLHRR